MRKRQDMMIHVVLLTFLSLTLLPLFFVVNNSMRTNAEQYRTFFGLPTALKDAARFTWLKSTGREDQIEVRLRTPAAPTQAAPEAAAQAAAVTDEDVEEPVEADTTTAASRWRLTKVSYGQAIDHVETSLTRGYRLAWKDLRGYMLNTLFVTATSTFGVLLLGSVSGYVFSRYKFAGKGVLLAVLLSILMIPPVLTLVPAFLLVKEFGMLNSYMVLILPYIAGAQIIAVFLFKSFFDGLPEELFESARLEGAGHFTLYWHIVLPLSKQVASVVAVITILGVWNNFLWPLIVNADPQYRVISSGLYYLSQTATGQNFSAMYAAFVISSLPLVVLFIYATKPFMKGLTSGAFKA